MEHSGHDAEVAANVASVASLAEPVRRSLYRFVAGQLGAVSRDQAAAGVDVAHHVAKFHLDRLERDGLLEVEYRRPTGRTGPGAGRPAKFYRRARRDIAVSLPERRYDLAGRLMAEAITAAGRSDLPLSDALQSAASAAGRRLGEQAAVSVTARQSQEALVGTLCAVLAELGYEPTSTPECIALDNCPFHSLAEEFTELVCGMNLDLISGLLSGLPQNSLRAELDPAPDRCCVTIAPTS